MAIKIYNTQIDLENEQYYSHDKTYSSGGFLFNFVHFQKDSILISYDIDGVLMGKQLEIGENTYANKIKGASNVLDFMNISNLLTKQKSGDPIKTTSNKKTNELIIKHTNQDSISKLYTFKLNTLQLISIENTTRNLKTVFSNQTEVNGITIAKTIDIYRNEKKLRQYNIKNISSISKIDPIKFVIPEAYVFPDKTIEFAPKGIQKIANNLYLITTADGGRNMLFKVIHNSIMVFGAPISDKVSEYAISLIENKFPNKTIDYVYVTHPHSDHIGGLTAYAKRKVVILADDYSIEAIKAYPRFKKDIQKFKFSAISNNQLLNDVRFFIPKNSHSLGQSFAYFEDSQIIYEGDFLEVPADNTIPNYISKTEQEFVEFVRDKELKIKRIVGNHRNANISLETMNKYYLNKKD